MMYKLKSSITCIAILLSFSCLHSQSKVMIQNAEDFRRFFEPFRLTDLKPKLCLATS